MNLKIGLLAISIIGIGLGSSAEAMAQTQPPAGCRTSVNRGAYQAGVASGRALTRQAWSGVNRSCAQLGRFTSILIDNVERLTTPPSSDSYVTCRHAGVVAGVYEEINTVWATCAVQSCQVGAFFGRLAGKLVCSIAAGHGPSYVLTYLPQLPPSAFPWLSERCCEGAFDMALQQCLPGSPYPWGPVREYVCSPPFP